METGKPALKSKISKHLVLADASASIWFAGSFFIGAIEKNPVLFVDNDSGSYVPNPADLFRIKAILESNLNGLNVVTYDRTDESLKLVKKQMIDESVPMK